MMPITQKGYETLKEKIKAVKAEFETMPAIIAEAREKGDLKENAEYHAAKERQGMLNAELGKLNSYLAQAQVVHPTSLPAGTVTFGKVIELEDLTTHSKETYTIVGPAETDAKLNQISVTSQLVKGLLGKKLNDEIKILVPSGSKRYKILDIKYYQ